MLNRRRFLSNSVVLAATTSAGSSLFAGLALAQEKTVDVAELMKPQELPDMTMGNADAKVTVVEYMSMTCSHCAHFAETTLPTIKEKYIDTGKVYYVLREFPLDPLAAAAFMLARKAPGGKYFEVVDYLLKTQADWAFVPDPVAGLRNAAKHFGFSPATFDATLSDQKLLDGINAIRERGSKSFGVDATPTFFINGVKTPGALTVEQMSAKVDALL